MIFALNEQCLDKIPKESERKMKLGTNISFKFSTTML